MIWDVRLSTEETPLVIDGPMGSSGFRHPALRARIATQMGFLLRAGEDAVQGGVVGDVDVVVGVEVEEAAARVGDRNCVGGEAAGEGGEVG